jgi:hypothetical protein
LQYWAVSVLDLPVCAWVGDHDPVHLDAVIITEIKKLLPIELSVVVGNDGVRDPETENNDLDKIYCLLVIRTR